MGIDRRGEGGRVGTDTGEWGRSGRGGGEREQTVGCDGERVGIDRGSGVGGERVGIDRGSSVGGESGDRQEEWGRRGREWG